MARESKRKRDERRFGKPERLADRIISQELYCSESVQATFSQEEWLERCKLFKSSISMIPIIESSNITDYFFDGHQESWSLPDFAPLYPPYGAFFIETSRPAPRVANPIKRGVSSFLEMDDYPDAWGAFFFFKEVDHLVKSMPDDLPRHVKIARYLAENEPNARMIHEAIMGSDDPVEEYRSYMEASDLNCLMANFVEISRRDSGSPHEADFNLSRTRAVLDNLRWNASVGIVMERHGIIFGPIATANFWIGRDGSPTDEVPFGYGALRGKGGELDEGIANGISAMGAALMQPLLLGISFMNYKGVATKANDPPDKVNRERRKHGMRPFLRYHTIEIEPLKRAMRSEGGIEEVGLKKAWHRVRGNLAVYRDSFFGRPLERPLAVWRPNHVRGSAERGVVVSDYNVKAPKAPAGGG